MDTSSLQIMLDSLGLIHTRYMQSRDSNQFNVFNVLFRKYDEVNLHSKILAELLDPFGSHQQGITFLDMFLEAIQLKGFSSTDAKVRREYRSIDILISNRTQAVVIENKLTASDQPEQLQRYYTQLQKEGYREIFIVYLSLSGQPPSEQSVGRLKDIAGWDEIFRGISYRFEILVWLKSCLKESYDKPAIRETIQQYKRLIEEITGGSMNEKESSDIVNFLALGDNALKAQLIAKNWSHVRWYTEWYFWRELESKLEKKYKISEVQKFSSKNIDSVVHQSRNRNPWFGIMFPVSKFNELDIYIFLERGTENVYYGATLFKNGARYEDAPKHSELVAALDFSEWGVSGSWLGGNYCEPEISFEAFNTETTVRLLNEKFRDEYITSLVAQVDTYIDRVRAAVASINKNGNTSLEI